MIGLRAQPLFTTFIQTMNEKTTPKKKQVPKRDIPWLVEIPSHSKFVFVTRLIIVFEDSVLILYVIFGVVHAIEGVQDPHCTFKIPLSLATC
jgi:hypothetical protein